MGYGNITRSQQVRNVFTEHIKKADSLKELFSLSSPVNKTIASLGARSPLFMMSYGFVPTVSYKSA